MAPNQKEKMKRTRLKKKSGSELRKLIDKADRALQDHYRLIFKNTPCESCGKRFDVMHHFFPKSSSTKLRYHKSNLIFLCNGCHFRHHMTGDPTIHARIIAKRGIKWFNELEKLRREHMSLTKQLAEEMIVKYKLSTVANTRKVV